MLEIRQVDKRYGKIMALQQISLKLLAGEIGAVVGPNGAGKSTLLEVVAGVLKPGAGQILVNGVDTAERAAHVRRLIAYLPEQCPLYNDLRVEEHLSYRGKLKGLTRKRLRARLRNVIENCSLTSIRHQLIGRLSQGQRQCVGLADVLLTEPRLLVLDEPFAAIDTEQALHLCQLLGNYSRHGAVLLATHRLDLVAQLAPQCIALYRGKIAGKLETQADTPLPERLKSLWQTYNQAEQEDGEEEEE